MNEAPEQGDIIRIDFDPKRGHEQGKRRTALVLSDSEYNAKVGLCVVVPLTSKIKGYPFEVAMVEGMQMGGVALADQLRTMDFNARGFSFIEAAPQSVLDEALGKVSALLGI